MSGLEVDRKALNGVLNYASKNYFLRDIMWLSSLVEPEHASYEWNFNPFSVLVLNSTHNFSIVVSFFFIP